MLWKMLTASDNLSDDNKNLSVEIVGEGLSVFLLFRSPFTSFILMEVKMVDKMLKTMAFDPVWFSSSLYFDGDENTINLIRNFAAQSSEHNMTIIEKGDLTICSFEEVNFM